jgi:large subunit ribosomal protein L28
VTLQFPLLLPWSHFNMAKQCEICHKGTVTGRQVSHAHNVTSRTWEPNLRRVRAVTGGVSRRIRVCTRCLRSGLVQKPLVRQFEQPEAAQ